LRHFFSTTLSFSSASWCVSFIISGEKRTMFFYLSSFEDEEQRQDWTFVRFDFFYCLFMSMCMWRRQN
jgi:hypothetical protein